MMTDTWDDQIIRNVDAESGNCRAAAENVALACGYTPIHIALGTDQWITDMISFSDGALALTNAGTALYITDFFGNTGHVLVPNVCRELETVCERGNHRNAFMQALLKRELDDPEGWADQPPVIARLYNILGVSPGELRAEHGKRHAI